MASESHYYQLTLDKLLYHGLYMAPEQRIYYRDKLSYTLREFRDRVEKLAAALSSLGVRTANGAWKMGDRVATLDWNTHWHYEAYFAIPMMGAVLHTINVRLAPQEIIYIMNHAEDKVLIAHQDFWPLVEKIAPQLKTVEKIVVLRESEQLELPSKVAGKEVLDYEAMLRDYGKGGYKFEELDENTVAAMCYTSGTTGLPKGVYHTHRQIVLHSISVLLQVSAFIPKEFQLNYQSVFMHIVPMFHVYSWGIPYAMTLLGAKQVFPGRFDAGLYLRLMAEHGVTHTDGVPTVLYMLLTHPDFPKYRDKIKGLVFVCGGSALPRGLAKLAWDNGIRAIVGYGLTETAPVLTIATITHDLVNAPEDVKWEHLAQRTGLPIPLVQLRVVDEEMRDVPRDGKTMGEIVVRAPWVTREYYKDPEKTAKAWRGGWFHTGDIAVWDQRGYILIMDRDKDVIKSGGEWISSLRLESLISLHECVGEVAVIAARHPKWQERPVAIIVPKPGCEEKLKPDDIMAHLKKFVDQGAIPKWWLPDKIIITREELPKTSVGKINKRVLRERYAGVLEQEQGK
ncbi:MAG: long-chain-fatty-acid--CoA ligase [Pyrodictiaceae archaeon]